MHWEGLWCTHRRGGGGHQVPMAASNLLHHPVTKLLISKPKAAASKTLSRTKVVTDDT